MNFQHSVYGSRRRVSAVPKTKTFLVEIPNDQGVPASEDVAILQDRIGLLEALLSQHGISVPPFVEAQEIPESITVPIVGYCKGPGCPISITMEIEAAFKVWAEGTYLPATDKEKADWAARAEKFAERDEDPGPCPIDSDGEVYHYNHTVEMTYRRDLLVAAFNGELSMEIAGVLASDDGGWLDILRDMGYWKAAPAAEAIADPEEQGEGGGVAPTGTDSSPTSVPATASAPPIS